MSQQAIDPMHPGGWPRKHSKLREMWWTLTGKWSLHRAWQAGHDHGSRMEYQRIIINGGDTIPIIDAAARATAELWGANISGTALSRVRRQTFIDRQMGEVGSLTRQRGKDAT